MVIGLALLTALVPVSLFVSGHSATGAVLNVAPNFTGSGAAGISVDPSTVDNSGSDTIEFDAAFFDANGDTDTEIVEASCSLNLYEGSDSNGTLVRTWTGTWDSAPSGSEFVIDPTGTSDDGLAFIADTAGGTDPGFVWTVPTSLTGSAEGVAHYIELYVEDDDGANAASGAVFTVVNAIQIVGVYRDDGVAVDTTSPWDWNFSSPTPGSFDVSSGDGIYEFWLVVRNAGTDANDSFIMAFIDDDFTSASVSDIIPIDGNVDFEYYESALAPGGSDDPDEHGFGITVNDDPDGIWSNADFTAVNNYMWLRYEIDIPAITGDATDYTASFTVAAD
jgi:hypothetical protein